MRFIKAHSLGNDFIILINSILPKKHDIVRLCNRRFGIGADGLVSLDVSNNKAEVRFFNADGSEASLCGNASRICGSILIDEYDIWSFTTASGIILIQCDNDLKGVKIPIKPEIKEIHHKERVFSLIYSGVPHMIYECKDFRLEKDDISIDFPSFEDYNWDFIDVTSDKIIINTFERGVGYTLGCSTGAAAVAYYMYKKNNMKDYSLEFPGGIAKATVDGEDVIVYSDVTIVYKGEY